MKNIIVIFLICIVSKASGNKISDAYEALSIYDYFKAKQLFYKSLPKYPTEASFGLAIIFDRNDNPFSNVDSSAKYISVCKTQFTDTNTYSLYHINNESIDSLAGRISAKGYETYCTDRSVKNLNIFLSRFYFANDNFLSKSYNIRDELQLDNASQTQSSDSVYEFLLSYPQSSFFWRAKKLFYEFQYSEKTPQKTPVQLKFFIDQFPENPNIAEAESILFEIIQKYHSTDSLNNFIKYYSTSLTKETAWKLLYNLSVKNYSKEELTNFLFKYPNYPYNETLLKEISLSQNILIPLKNLKDKFGFIDTLGNWIIQPQFDDASSFSEGFASVCRNDSCFYIDKEGNKISDNYFEETENYKNGVAIVKKDNQFFLINRSGQYISKGYQDINESSDKLFVCKSNNVYGAINAKGEIVIPFNYTKLGNFKNNFAYYMSAHYGLVDIYNNALQAQWDWISDVDTNSIVIVKKKNQFGLMTINEQLILPTEYDYVSPGQFGIYLVVKNNLYGFYNSKEKCFVTSVDYDYDPAFPTSYYTNGKYFKLIQDDEVALVDANGRYSINFDTYTNVFFAKCDIIRVQKNNKFGFIDRKLKAVTSVEYDRATDFDNYVAISSKGATTFLISKTGKAIYSIKNAQILNSQNSLFIVTQNELVGLLNLEGKLILNIEFESINLIEHQLYACIKNNELYLYNLNTKFLKKL